MLPTELLEADATIHRVLNSCAFSKHLNPVNGTQARLLFSNGAAEPPFVYDAPVWADEVQELLQKLVIPKEHPLGLELHALRDSILLLIHALQERSQEAFAALNSHSNWAPMIEKSGPLPGDVSSGVGVDADEMKRLLEEALKERGMLDWVVEFDPVMAARILVDSPKKLIRVHPQARFSGNDRIGLIAHEIDVHATRGYNGTQQPLKLFTAGLVGSDTTEEGLAIFAEELTGTLSPRFTWRQQVLHEAVLKAESCGFRELFEWVREQLGEQAAWTISLRVKRGLKKPGLPGVYAKDTIYLRGWRQIHRWLEEGGDIRMLYVGKVGTQHPVAEWIREGLVRPGQVPALFKPLEKG
jgi:hypothetical protein